MFGARAIKRRRDKEAELKAAKANGPPPAFERQGPPGVRGAKAKGGKGRGKMKGKCAMVGGKKEMYDLIVNIDLEEWKLSDQQVADYKEVFMLFDRDEDGVLSFSELQVVMKSLGQRPTEEDLLSAVREVSEDYIYDTVEFNEFLQLMSKQQEQSYSQDDLVEAFSLFDEDDDGLLTVSELSLALTQLGDTLTKNELKQMLRQAKYITEHDVRPLEPTLDSSEDKPKEITEVLDKADIEEETINYKAFAEFMCSQLSISNPPPQASNNASSPKESKEVEPAEAADSAKQSQNCDGKDESETDLAQASSHDTTAVKAAKEVTLVRKCDPVQ